ncbi:MAG: Collagenase-like protease, PrtC family [Candidatus Electronema aureum]|uniref:Collagenase-like protease, PrtC family n=1 Tax=Candidatus Electronema aureum TaxID=2005002 RepID=A0A521G5J5_9BACT|nr:MAG: Collagenase-like protease, PrtC family [Candidatus Electronema aureum]
MTPFLDVPFLPEEAYIEFLNSNSGHIDSVHFSLPGVQRMDNRAHSKSVETVDVLAGLLDQISIPKRYALLNSRFYGPALLTDKQQLRTLISSLEFCVERKVISGIIYCDHYLLQCLSNEAPELAAQLEAVPGINTLLDSQGKIDAHLAYIGETHFHQPTRIVLDRSLNRNLNKLTEIARWCREGLSDLKLELVGNEGCLPYCPYRSAHDAYIALDNCTDGSSSNKINNNLGCKQLLKKQPYRILQSPFIRPEDVDSYLYDVDLIKISGRNLNSTALRRIITAYIDRSWKDNLLELLDSSHWLASELYVDNSGLSFDFANMLSVCNNRCETCRFCMELFNSISHSLPTATGH